MPGLTRPPNDDPTNRNSQELVEAIPHFIRRSIESFHGHHRHYTNIGDEGPEMSCTTEAVASERTVKVRFKADDPTRPLNIRVGRDAFRDSAFTVLTIDTNIDQLSTSRLITQAVTGAQGLILRGHSDPYTANSTDSSRTDVKVCTLSTVQFVTGQHITITYADATTSTSPVYDLTPPTIVGKHLKTLNHEEKFQTYKIGAESSGVVTSVRWDHRNGGPISDYHTTPWTQMGSYSILLTVTEDAGKLFPVNMFLGDNTWTTGLQVAGQYNHHIHEITRQRIPSAGITTYKVKFRAGNDDYKKQQNQTQRVYGRPYGMYFLNDDRFDRQWWHQEQSYDILNLPDRNRNFLCQGATASTTSINIQLLPTDDVSVGQVVFDSKYFTGTHVVTNKVGNIVTVDGWKSTLTPPEPNTSITITHFPEFAKLWETTHTTGMYLNKNADRRIAVDGIAYEFYFDDGSGSGDKLQGTIMTYQGVNGDRSGTGNRRQSRPHDWWNSSPRLQFGWDYKSQDIREYQWETLYDIQTPLFDVVSESESSKAEIMKDLNTLVNSVPTTLDSYTLEFTLPALTPAQDITNGYYGEQLFFQEKITHDTSYGDPGFQRRETRGAYEVETMVFDGTWEEDTTSTKNSNYGRNDQRAHITISCDKMSTDAAIAYGLLTTELVTARDVSLATGDQWLTDNTFVLRFDGAIQRQSPNVVPTVHDETANPDAILEDYYARNAFGNQREDNDNCFDTFTITSYTLQYTIDITSSRSWSKLTPVTQGSTVGIIQSVVTTSEGRRRLNVFVSSGEFHNAAFTIGGEATTYTEAGNTEAFTGITTLTASNVHSVKRGHCFTGIRGDQIHPITTNIVHNDPIWPSKTMPINGVYVNEIPFESSPTRYVRRATVESCASMRTWFGSSSDKRKLVPWATTHIVDGSKGNMLLDYANNTEYAVTELPALKLATDNTTSAWPIGEYSCWVRQHTTKAHGESTYMGRLQIGTSKNPLQPTTIRVIVHSASTTNFNTDELEIQIKDRLGGDAWDTNVSTLSVAAQESNRAQWKFYKNTSFTLPGAQHPVSKPFTLASNPRPTFTAKPTAVTPHTFNNYMHGYKSFRYKWTIPSGNTPTLTLLPPHAYGSDSYNSPEWAESKTLLSYYPGTIIVGQDVGKGFSGADTLSINTLYGFPIELLPLSRLGTDAFLKLEIGEQMYALRNPRFNRSYQGVGQQHWHLKCDHYVKLSKAPPTIDDKIMARLSLPASTRKEIDTDLEGVKDAFTASAAIKTAVGRITSGKAKIVNMAWNPVDIRERRGRRDAFKSIVKSAFAKMGGAAIDIDDVDDIMKKTFNIADGATIGKVKLVPPPASGSNLATQTVDTESFSIYCPIEDGQTLKILVANGPTKNFEYHVAQHATGEEGTSLYSVVTVVSSFMAPFLPGYTGLRPGTDAGKRLYDNLANHIKTAVDTSVRLQTGGDSITSVGSVLFTQDDVYRTRGGTTIFFGSVGGVGTGSASGHGDPYITTFLE